MESLAKERDELKVVAGELGRELHQSKAELGEQRTASEYLNTQLEVRREGGKGGGGEGGGGSRGPPLSTLTLSWR